MTHSKNKTILVILLIFMWNSESFAQDEISTRYRDTTIYASSFSAEKKIEIITHFTNDSPNESTSVLIVLDAYTLLQLTSAFTNHLINQFEISPMIIIGLFPEDRLEEYTGDDADKTVDFINNEIKSLVKNKFPKSKSISIMGHSASADFLIEKGGKLENIVSICAMSPLILQKDWKNYITPFIQKDIDYYISSSVSDFEGRLKFVNYIDSLKLENIHTKVFESRDHGDNFIPGIESYLTTHFRQYSWLSDEELETIAISTNKLEALKKIKNTRENDLKIDFTPNYMSIFILTSVVGNDEYKQVYSWLLTLDLDVLQKVTVYMCLGDYYENQESFEEALNSYKLAYADLPDWVTNKEDIHDNIIRLNTIIEK